MTNMRTVYLWYHVTYTYFKGEIMGTFSPTGLLLFIIIIGLIGFLAFKLVKKLRKK